jgi:competence protein ComEA
MVTPRAQVARVPALPPPSFASDPLAFLSRAPADSLDLLPGIGPVLAARIVAARRAHGSGFTSWDEIDRVKGIGPTMIARWRALSSRQ